MPSRLWRLALSEACRVLTPALHLWWSGTAPQLDLAERADRFRAYELVLREGRPEDIRSIVDGAFLVDALADLVLPAEVRKAWQPVLEGSRHVLTVAS